jgi:hypothetical protein
MNGESGGIGEEVNAVSSKELSLHSWQRTEESHRHFSVIASSQDLIHVLPEIGRGVLSVHESCS